MAISVKWFLRNDFYVQFDHLKKSVWLNCFRNCSNKEFVNGDQEEFRVLQIKPLPRTFEKKKELKIKLPPPRTERMPTDQDWTNVWPGPKTFHPAVVPLPVRQGINKHGPPPDKFANVELMKIPNFLHLTPKAIEKHCAAIKQFCTPWPSELKTLNDIEKYFPVEVISSDYCHSSPTIRDPMARIMTLRIKLKHLNLNKHAKDKFLRLVGKRYDPKTDYVTITTDSCPMKKQNYDYAQYLLTALLYESRKYEEWESNKQDADMEAYIFSSRRSSRNVRKIFEYNNTEVPDTTEFAKAVEDWHNLGDKPQVIQKYKEASLKLLSLPNYDTVT